MENMPRIKKYIIKEKITSQGNLRQIVFVWRHNPSKFEEFRVRILMYIFKKLFNSKYAGYNKKYRQMIMSVLGEMGYFYRNLKKNKVK